MSLDLDTRFAFAEALVRRAGALALDMRTDPALDTAAKGPRDFVTAADKAVEVLIRDELERAFGDAVLGEEDGGITNGARLWIVDPIDGTYNYMHSNPRWCVSLGLLIDGVPTLGCIYAPQTNDMYVARRGAGAFRNGKRLAVSTSRFETAPLVEIGCSPRLPLAGYLAHIETLMSAGIETRRGGSGALGLAQVATGETDGYLEHHIHAWDVAAGLLIVTEAGGLVSDFFAGDGLRNGNQLLAAAPWLASRLKQLTGIDASIAGG